MSFVSRVNPLPDTSPGFTHPQAPGSTSIPDTAFWVTCPLSPGRNHLTKPSPGVKCPVSLVTPCPDPVPGVTFPVSRVTAYARSYTWGHISTLSMMTPPHQNFYLWSYVHSLHGDHHSQTLILWSHFQGDTTAPPPTHTCGYSPQISG